MLILAGAAFRISPLTDNRFHPDEALFSTLARLIASGRDPLLAHTSLLVDKPPLFYYTLAGAVTVAGATEIALRLPGLLFSLVSLALCAKLSWRLWHSWTAAILSLVLVSLSPFAILFAPTVFSDPQYMMWLLASLIAMCEARWGWGGFLLGLAIATKQSSVFFLPVVVLIGLTNSNTASAGSSPFIRRMLRFLCGLGLVVLAIIVWDQLRAPAASFWIAGLQANNPGRLIRSDEVWARASAWLQWASAFSGSRPADGLLSVVLLAALPLEWFRGRLRRKAVHTITVITTLIAYVSTLWFVAFPLLDRYLLPMVYLAAMLCGRGIENLTHYAEISLGLRHLRKSAVITIMVLIAGLLVPSAVRAAHSLYPVGGAHGAYAGIDRVSGYLSTRPAGTVVYSHSLGWMLDYYLFDAYVYQAYFSDPAALADDLRTFGGTGDERYLVLASSETINEIADSIHAAGYQLLPVETTRGASGGKGIRLFRIERSP